MQKCCKAERDSLLGIGNKIMKKFSLALLTGTAAVGLASPALAQGVADNEQPAAEGNEQSDNTIVVTATRREVNLQDVPAAVVSINPEEFTLNGQTGVRDLIRYQPGLFFNDGEGTSSRGSITARGIPQLGSTPTFATYVDDLPITSNTPYNQGSFISIDGLLLDVERVEIIKGPQGTLFGATSVGGLLRYITKKPALSEARGTATADIGFVNGGDIGQTYNGRVSVPLVEDRLGVSVGAFYQKTAGYPERVNPATGAVIEEDVGGSEIFGFAGDILFQATDNLELRVKYMRQETDTDDLFQVQLAGPGTTDGAFTDFSTVSTGDDLDLTTEYISGSIEWDLDFATLSSTTSWSNVGQDVNSDVTAAFGGFIDLITGQAPGTTQNVTLVAPLTTKKFIQEVRLVSAPSDTFEWLVGGYYANERGTNLQDTVITPEPPFRIFIADFPSQYKEYAGYGNATIYLSDTLDVTAGLRVTRNEVDFDFFSDGFLVTGGGPAQDVEQTTTDTVVTYLGNIRWRPTDDLSLYARVASGYRGPAPNFVLTDPATGLPATFPVVEPDSAWSYEIGAKGSIADGVLDFDVSIFYIDFSNFQAGFTVNNLGVLGNSQDGLKSKGFDASFTLNPFDGFSLTTNVGYASSQLNSDEPGFGGIADVQVPQVPKWKASLLWNYTHDLSSDWTANFGGGIRYIDSFQSTFTFAEAVGVEVGDRTIADINLSVSNDNLRFGLYVTNLFNSRKLTSRSDSIIGANPATGDLIFNSAGVFERPRTIGGNVTFSF